MSALYRVAAGAKQAGPVGANFEVQTEVRLTIQPQRADMLLLRRLDQANRDDEAKLLRWLWRRLGRITIVEFKSPVDSPFHPGDLLRLVGYGFPLRHGAHQGAVRAG